MKCVCNHGTPCTLARVYDARGETVAEILMENVKHLKPEFTAVCAGEGLRRINQLIREARK